MFLLLAPFCGRSGHIAAANDSTTRIRSTERGGAGRAQIMRFWNAALCAPLTREILENLCRFLLHRTQFMPRISRARSARCESCDH